MRVGALNRNTGGLRLCDERGRITPHPERRHQVLEHGTGPGEQYEAAKSEGVIPGELEPALLRQIAASDGEEGGDARFRGQQIVAGGEDATSSGIEPDGKHL